jgi:hypothetical protein
VVELAIASESDGAAKRVRLEAHIGVGKEQPIAGGDFVGLLKGMRLAEPAFGKFGDVDDAESSRMREVASRERSSTAMISRRG